jgi:RNA polymerase sigma factor for flagellar operon FliA
MGDIMKESRDAYLKELWKSYRETGSIDVRNLLIAENMKFVKYLVKKVADQKVPGIEQEDLIQLGVCGLMEAIERYDPMQGVKFETYASWRVQGAIIDQIRYYGKTNGGLSRSAIAKSKLVEETIKILERENKRHPSRQEIADKLGVSLDEFIKMLSDISIGVPLSLDDNVGSDDNISVLSVVKDERVLDPEESYILKEKQELLSSFIEQLPVKEKKVIRMYYYDKLTLKEIGKLMDRSESRISQLHTQALDRLKSKINGGV